RIIMIRRQLAIEFGFVVPVFRIGDNIQLEPNEYRLKIKRDEVARVVRLLDHYVAMTSDLDDDTIDGIQTKGTAFGLPVKWINETKDLIDHLREEYTILADEVTPDPLSVGDIQKVLAKLLKENISIRNLPVIFETLADFSKMTSDTDLLAEYVRQSLSSQITK